MYEVIYTRRFVKDVRLCVKRGLDIFLLEEAIDLLQNTGTLPAKYHAHKLVGNRKDEWECHIRPDWLLCWRQDDQQLTLLFVNTGTHADLFK